MPEKQPRGPAAGDLGLQEMLHMYHNYVKDFKYAQEIMDEQEDCQVVIRPDTMPTGEHWRGMEI